MRLGKCWIALTTLLTLFFSLISSSPILAAQEPNIVGEAAVLMDLNSGQVIWSKNEDQVRGPASTTKILTALIALEKGNLQDEVTVSEDAVRVAGTRVYLVAGEKQTLEDLLYAMLLNSANDAAYAIAEHIGGSIEAFAQMMNEKAKSLGAVNSNFVNPNGLSEENHYTTALDLALISRAAMENPTFRQMVATQNRTWEGAEWTSTLVNGNKLLSQYEGTIGVKTGYTSEAKWCLVSAAERNNEAFLAVVLGSNNKQIWTDSKALLDYGFNNFYTQTLAKAGQVVGEVEIDEEKLGVSTVSDLTYLQSKLTPVQPEERIHLMPLRPPIAQGDKVGEIRYFINGEEIGKLDLVANNSVERHFTPWEIWSYFTSAVVILFSLITIVRLFAKRRSRTFGYSSYRLRRFHNY